MAKEMAREKTMNIHAVTFVQQDMETGEFFVHTPGLILGPVNTREIAESIMLTILQAFETGRMLAQFEMRLALGIIDDEKEVRNEARN